MSNFNQIYKEILENIWKKGVLETNKRTKTKIKVSKTPIFFTIDFKNDLLPIPGNRTVWPYVAAAETAWQFLGTTDPEFIMKYAPKIWKDFIEDGKVKTAYGFRQRKAFGRDQIDLALKALKKDKTNRQCFISNWNPISDGLGEPNQPKNIPCPLGFTVNIIDDKVNMSVFVRSSDVFVGLIYDVLAYSLVLDAFASSLKLPKGNLSFTLAHAHIYEPHFEFVKQALKSKWKNVKVKFKSKTIAEIQKNPDKFVLDYKSEKVKNFNSENPKIIL